jgi:hypothetical protein
MNYKEDPEGGREGLHAISQHKIFSKSHFQTFLDQIPCRETVKLKGSSAAGGSSM